MAKLVQAPAAPSPDARYKADILVIVAHPDDGTEITGYLARVIYDEHKRVAVALLHLCAAPAATRFPTPKAAPFATNARLKRAVPMLRLALRTSGSSGGLDTPTQNVLDSLGHWNHGAVLERAVRLVRLTRPEVIMTWIPDYVDGENHGDHQASAVIATEAFDTGREPHDFPAQVAAPQTANITATSPKASKLGSRKSCITFRMPLIRNSKQIRALSIPPRTFHPRVMCLITKWRRAPQVTT